MTINRVHFAYAVGLTMFESPPVVVAKNPAQTESEFDLMKGMNPYSCVLLELEGRDLLSRSDTCQLQSKGMKELARL